MFCCAATASRTAPLITQTVEHGHNPVVYSQYTQTLGNATLLEVRGGGIYIRDNFTPYSERLRDARPHRPGHRHQLGERADRAASSSTTGRPSMPRSPTPRPGSGPARTTSRPASRPLMRRSAPSRRRIGGVSYTDLSGAPYRATYNDPQATGGRIRSWGAYLQDTWTLNDRATLNLGLRFDAIRGDVPELSSDAEIEGTDGVVVLAPGRHLSRASRTWCRSTRSRRASASRSGSTSRDGRCSSRPTGASTASS